MLKVQEYLVQHSLTQLQEEFGIRVQQHDCLPLITLNYNQIDSPKTGDIVKECRGLVLNLGTWGLVARAFPRFYNWGEVQDEMGLFDFDGFTAQEKVDGSLILIYYYHGKWRINTRGSFGNELIWEQPVTWREAVLQGLGLNDESELDNILDHDLTYVCELCSPWNKVIRKYDMPVVYLLSVFVGEDELTVAEVDWESANAGIFLRPLCYDFSCVEEIQEFLKYKAQTDATFEGVVIRDKNNRRWKIKSASYLALHQLKGDGQQLFSPKHLLPFILGGDIDELLTYFPKVETKLNECKQVVDTELAKLLEVVRESQGIENQKEFALAIVGKTKFTGLLFGLRQKHGENIPEQAVVEAWRNSKDIIFKFLFS